MDILTFITQDGIMKIKITELWK